MKQKLTSLLIVPVLFLSGCAGFTDFFKGASVPSNTPITATGTDLQTAVAIIAQDYADASKGNVNYLWAIEKGLEAYQLYVKSSADIKQIISDFSATKGQSLAERIAALFRQSSGSPQQKAAAIAAGVNAAASNSAP